MLLKAKVVGFPVMECAVDSVDQPLLHGGNVPTNLATRDEGCTWVLFTEAGSALAATLSFTVQALA